MRKHWNYDVSAWQMSKLFNVPEAEIHKARLQLKLPPQDLDHITVFHTPFPFEIARQIKLFSWSTYLKEESPNGEAQVHSTDP